MQHAACRAAARQSQAHLRAALAGQQPCTQHNAKPCAKHRYVATCMGHVAVVASRTEVPGRPGEGDATAGSQRLNELLNEQGWLNEPEPSSCTQQYVAQLEHTKDHDMCKLRSLQRI